MRIEGSIALVTGANGGLGRAFVAELLDRGVAGVYVATRSSVATHDNTVTAAGRQRDRIRPLVLDITDPLSVASAAAAAADVTLLVNNAGINTHARMLTGTEPDIRREMEVAYFGTLSMIRAFAPGLAAAGGGAILNVLSDLSWVSSPTEPAYSAAKSAAWSLTNAVRHELAPQGTLVTALHLGVTDTPMSSGYTGAKNAPVDVVRQALDGIDAGLYEILTDEQTREARRRLALPPLG